MMEERFADYILNENDWVTKLNIMFSLSERGKIFFDKAVVFKVEIAKLFMELMEIEIDVNLVITAGMLYNCKKNPTENDILKCTKEGIQFLKTLGFDDRFCRICEQVNIYSEQEQREREADILVLTEHFCELLLDKPERNGLKPELALEILENEILRGQYNIFLGQFKEFVKKMQEVYI